MHEYQTGLLERSEVAEGTLAFKLEKPAGFVFRAGQSADLTLLSPRETDAEGDIRTFSIAAAPAESALMFATRLRDTAFKRNLRTMEIGTTLKIDRPAGSFNLHNNSANPPALPPQSIAITPSLPTLP